MISQLLFAITAQSAESGFEPFFQDLFILEPVPQVDWICGETAKVIWNQGLNIRNGIETVPPTPETGLINISLATQVNGGPWYNGRLKKKLIAQDVKISAEELTITVNCEDLCPECLSDTTGGRVSQTYHYLLFEDVNPSEDCKKNHLNYDEPNCWTVRSQGAVNVSSEEHLEDWIEDDMAIWNRNEWWFDIRNPDLGMHMWGVAAAVSHRTGYYLYQDSVVELPYGYGKWDIMYADYRGILGASVWKSQMDNVIVIGFRPTTTGLYAYDDWMTDFFVNQRGCGGGDQEDVFIDCDPTMKFHVGFMYEYLLSMEGIRSSLMDILNGDQICNDDDPVAWRILVTGMSQGGGIATIAIYDLYNLVESQLNSDYFNRIEFMLYTFGGGPGGNENLALWIEKNIPLNNRDRFVMRFDTDRISESDTMYKAGALRIDDVDVGPVSVLDLDQLVKCINRSPPSGIETPAYANWKWRSEEDLGLTDASHDDLLNENSAMWIDGDLITMLTTNVDCKGTSGQLIIDTRFTLVTDPVFMHWDPDEFKIWCTDDGCTEDPSGWSPARPNAKEPMRVYSNGIIKGDFEEGYDGECVYPGTGLVEYAGLCHDIGLYGYGVGKFKNNQDYIGTVNEFGSSNKGCLLNTDGGTPPDSTSVPHGYPPSTDVVTDPESTSAPDGSLTYTDAGSEPESTTTDEYPPHSDGGSDPETTTVPDNGYPITNGSTERSLFSGLMIVFLLMV